MGSTPVRLIFNILCSSSVWIRRHTYPILGVVEVSADHALLLLPIDNQEWKINAVVGCQFDFQPPATYLMIKITEFHYYSVGIIIYVVVAATYLLLCTFKGNQLYRTTTILAAFVKNNSYFTLLKNIWTVIASASEYADPEAGGPEADDSEAGDSDATDREWYEPPHSPGQNIVMVTVGAALGIFIGVIISGIIFPT
jgi:hypothetical protein